MMPSSIVFAGATAALLLAIAGSARWPAPRTLRHPAVLAAFVLFFASVIVRATCVRPTLIHADVVAPELVDCVLQFPAACTTRGASYGQYGFLVLGALTRPFGNDLHALFRAMAIVGALDVALLAVLAARLSGSPYGALVAVAAAGTNPVLMRVAGSEDMHDVALLVGLVALVAMDVFAVTRRSAPLVAAALALCLLVHTRQTFLAFLPCAFLLAVARGGRNVPTCRRFWAAALVVVAVLLTRIAATAASGGLAGQMTAILGQPVLLPSILRHHALLDVARFGLLPAATVAAVIWACFAGRVARATALAFALNFVVTYPCGMPSPGVELAQRLPVVAFGTLLVAMAGAALVTSRTSAAARGAAAAGVAIALTVAPPFFPGWRMLAVQTPIHQEYLAVEAAAAALPPAFALVDVPTTETTMHASPRYAGLLARLGKQVRVVPVDEIAAAPVPRLFLEDIDCWAYSFHELTGVWNDAPEAGMRQLRWDRVLFDRQPSPLRPPAGLRPECRPFVGTPIGPGRVITDPPDDPPFLFYAARAVLIQFHQVPVPATG